MKPSTSLADPHPAPTVIPQAFVKDNAADYESELAVVIGKPCKNVSEEDALDYLLGCVILTAHDPGAKLMLGLTSFTASNDMSSRVAQFAQSQWCYSKSFDGACPIGPAFLHKSQVKNIAELRIKGTLNGETVQESEME
jgi:2-keto-4-pentenoate hydratase/2-oxohepta-3-ene-1,7-dioic acid hydratase in catechol pathway